VIPTWSSPLPDFSRPAVSARFKIGPHAFHLLISPVMADVAGEPDTELVQLMVLLDGRPVTLRDLGATAAIASGLWSYLCSKLIDLTVDFYDPRPRPVEGEVNPRLGCWGTRPDLLDEREDDSTLALVVGISTWTVGASPRGTDGDYVRELAQTVAEVLAYWVLSIERDKQRRAASGAR
jgi:hypothetical protein